MVKVHACILAIRQELSRRRLQIRRVLQTNSVERAVVSGKIMAAMMANCYRRLPSKVAREVRRCFRLPGVIVR